MKSYKKSSDPKPVPKFYSKPQLRKKKKLDIIKEKSSDEELENTQREDPLSI